MLLGTLSLPVRRLTLLLEIWVRAGCVRRLPVVWVGGWFASASPSASGLVNRLLCLPVLSSVGAVTFIDTACVDTLAADLEARARTAFRCFVSAADRRKLNAAQRRSDVPVWVVSPLRRLARPFRRASWDATPSSLRTGARRAARSTRRP